MAEVDRAEAFNRAGPIAGRMEIKDVRSRLVHAELQADYDPDRRMTYDFEQETSFLADRGFFIVSNAYEITITHVPSEDVDGAETSSPEIATLKVVLDGLFELHSDESDPEPTNEQLRAYAESTGSLALYPYLRHRVSELTTSLGLPPLLLGVQRINFEGVQVPGADD